MKTASGDLHFVGHTPSLLFQRSISARHRKKMTPDPRSAGLPTLGGYSIWGSRVWRFPIPTYPKSHTQNATIVIHTYPLEMEEALMGGSNES